MYIISCRGGDNYGEIEYKKAVSSGVVRKSMIPENDWTTEEKEYCRNTRHRTDSVVSKQTPCPPGLRKQHQ